MDTDDQTKWQEFLGQGEHLHERLRTLFETLPKPLSAMGVRIPNTPEAKLALYLSEVQDRHSLFSHCTTPEQKRRRNAQILRHCIDLDKFPENFFVSRELRNKENGIIAPYEQEGLPDEIREKFRSEERHQLMKSIQNDQFTRLKQWVKYLNDPANNVPIWFRFYVLSNAVKLKEYDTKRETFPKRSATSTANFPELNPKVINNIFKHITDPEFHERMRQQVIARQSKFESRKSPADFPEVDAAFPRLYDFWTKEFRQNIDPQDLDAIEGKWKFFEQGSSVVDLVKSVSGFNTGWCTANYGQASGQIADGHIHIFFTPNQTKEPIVPRILIRSVGNKVVEVRGRSPHQELETSLLDVAHEKLSEIPGGVDYFAQVESMRGLTELTRKKDAGQHIDRNDLIFIYEIEKPILQFGRIRDPRIEEFLEDRNTADDIAQVFSCNARDVAFTPEEITPTTQVCMFNMDHKNIDSNVKFPNLIAVVGDLNSMRMQNEFPHLTFVSGQARFNSTAPRLAFVAGDLHCQNTNIDMPELTRIGGTGFFSSASGSFPKLEYIGGDFWAAYSRAEFPALKFIGRDARLETSKIERLPMGLIVQGHIHGELPGFKLPFDDSRSAL